MWLFNSFLNEDILKAIEAGNRKNMQLALQLASQGGAPRLNEGNSSGKTPLHIAAGHPRHPDSVCEALVRELLKHSANPCKQDNEGCTALHWAAQQGHQEVMRVLLAHSPHLNSMGNRAGQTAQQLVPADTATSSSPPWSHPQSPGELHAGPLGGPNHNLPAPSTSKPGLSPSQDPGMPHVPASPTTYPPVTPQQYPSPSQVHAYMQQQQQQQQPAPPVAQEPSGTLTAYLSTGNEYTLEQLKLATNNFSEANRLGQGGFAVVYYGYLHQLHVAVKKPTTSIDPEHVRYFRVECKVLSTINHPNIIPLIGTCPEEGILVYQLAPLGSLHDNLFGADQGPGDYSVVWPATAGTLPQAGSSAGASSPFAAPAPSQHPPLTWKQCIKVVWHVARGLMFLHSKGLVHRNIKTGTFGYVPPEFLHAKVTGKWDIYALGIVLLQLVSKDRLLKGSQLRKAMLAACNADAATFIQAIDSRWASAPDAAKQLTALALQCTENDPGCRLTAEELANDLLEMN